MSHETYTYCNNINILINSTIVVEVNKMYFFFLNFDCPKKYFGKKLINIGLISVKRHHKRKMYSFLMFILYNIDL